MLVGMTILMSGSAKKLRTNVMLSVEDVIVSAIGNWVQQWMRISGEERY